MSIDEGDHQSVNPKALGNAAMSITKSSINNTKDEITFTFNYTDIKFGKFGQSKLIYNIYTQIWTSTFNTTSFNTICKNYDYL